MGFFFFFNFDHPMFMKKHATERIMPTKAIPPSNDGMGLLYGIVSGLIKKWTRYKRQADEISAKENHMPLLYENI